MVQENIEKMAPIDKQNMGDSLQLLFIFYSYALSYLRWLNS